MLTSDEAALEPQEKGSRERSGVQSLERGFALLQTIAAHPDGITLSDLSRSVGLHNSTAFHLVRTMVTLGYVRQQADSKRYILGRKVFALAANARSEIDLIAMAEPVLHELSELTSESSHVAIYSGDEVLIITRASGTGAFQLRESGGGIRPGHATAVGKVLLAFLDDERRGQYLANHPLKPLTERTIVDPERLIGELETVRRSGVAYDDAEFNPEVRCVAVPVRDFTGSVVAALGVSGPVWRVTLQSLNTITGEVQRAAAALASELGGHPERD